MKRIHLFLFALILFFISQFTSVFSEEMRFNERLYQIYNNIYSAQSANKKTTLSYSEIEFLFEKVCNHEVTSLESLKKYDPTGILGFCFGRAMATELFALKMGLQECLIKKLFIIGKMEFEGVNIWRFHVTTIVPGELGKWYTIDSTLNSPLEMESWIKAFRCIYDKSEKCYLYITHAHSVIPKVKDFPDSDKETGKNIIELSFNPEGRPGFTQAFEIASRTYELNNLSAREYFSDMSETDENSRFSFESVQINDEVIPYNNYFSDLLETIVNASESEFKPTGTELPLIVQNNCMDNPVPHLRLVRKQLMPVIRGNMLKRPISFRFDRTSPRK
ncbi:MAG: hypothetical protein HQM10_15835 [Candidatus Riflebacteria bacterium]|nr:hypothetical protein [Candidatus Riflebacteria bacterium]